MRQEHAKILCVDQDAKSLKGLVYLLRTAKYHVIAALSADKALEVIRKEQRLDMAVFNFTDTSRRLEKGQKEVAGDQLDNELRIAHALREKNPKLPILFMLPKGDPGIIGRLAAIPNSELLFPPYESNYLLFIIKTGLDGGYLLANL
ncbi:hypothetical protein JW933_08185 [candidate division FCPU426 bacterium]|nr:hypothetical protein [candidate division FCPU426 bacterium]